jgi:hypothetical protein
MNTLKAGDQLEICGKKILIQTGDYITFDGISERFCPGDGRIFVIDEWHTHSSLFFPPEYTDRIPSDGLRNEIACGDSKKRNLIIQWVF